MNLFFAVLFAVGGVICHQKPERSFFWAGQQFPVCARCTGLYASAAVGLAAWFAVKSTGACRRIPIDRRVALRVLAVAALPTALSVASGTALVWDGSNAARALFSVPLGACAGAIVAAVATKDLR